jgi:hypothetical protein
VLVVLAVVVLAAVELVAGPDVDGPEVAGPLVVVDPGAPPAPPPPVGWSPSSEQPIDSASTTKARRPYDMRAS